MERLNGEVRDREKVEKFKDNNNSNFTGLSTISQLYQTAYGLERENSGNLQY
jgi:hypothetical protein